MLPLVVIEAPGKVKRVQAAMREAGMAVDVWATRGHFLRNPDSLWPLAIDMNLQETLRRPDTARLASLRNLANGRSVIIATDPDQEGDVIARDVYQLVADIAKDVQRLKLGSLRPKSVARALSEGLSPIDDGSAAPGDARRILDRLIGSALSRPARPVGRVLSAGLGALARQAPTIGYVTLTVPAADGGPPFTAHVPVTAQTRAMWERRAKELVASARVARVQPRVFRPWKFADLLLVANREPIWLGMRRAGGQQWG